MNDSKYLTKKTWTVLVISCIINLVIGTGYAWSVFGNALAAKFGITPGEAAMAFTLCNAGVLGPMIMRATFNSSGSYQTAYLICLVLAALGIVFAFVYKVMSRGKKA